ncbi:hypothetical protein IMSHALPRED_010992 [Imshaugia aleurites]|uniref:F-box domain-containing protein n=1 Tax=Imshaugia aleurites TaxID=172621 RepID=A0A8H3GBZ7_9LECA|nr:hypothetical protein IMSHALPRED_010992 [Imshaugia aleurites]
MSASLLGVPAEIFEHILSYIPPQDYLKVKLLSKDFSAYASHVFKWKEMTKGEVVQGQTNWEASLKRGRHLRVFICTHCGLVKPTNDFTDNQAVKTNHKRICISCGISNGTYTKGKMPTINGQEHIPCWRCRKAVPKYNKWEEILASGKAGLTKAMDGSRTNGHLRLDALAFCQPCLGVMMPYKQAGSKKRQNDNIQ